MWAISFIREGMQATGQLLALMFRNPKGFLAGLVAAFVIFLIIALGSAVHGVLALLASAALGYYGWKLHREGR